MKKYATPNYEKEMLETKDVMSISHDDIVETVEANNVKVANYQFSVNKFLM